MSLRASFAVSLRGVRKSFANGVEALAGLTVDIRPQEFVSLLGPSGCGKSTALRIIAGLSEPSSGRIEWPVEEAPAGGSRPEIGIVFQEPTLMPWSTVARNVRLPLDLHGEAVAQANARVDAALEHVGLAQFADAFPRELSGGMKMLAAIARALVVAPKLILLDTPFE